MDRTQGRAKVAPARREEPAHPRRPPKRKCGVKLAAWDAARSKAPPGGIARRWRDPAHGLGRTGACLAAFYTDLGRSWNGPRHGWNGPRHGWNGPWHGWNGPWHGLEHTLRRGGTHLGTRWNIPWDGVEHTLRRGGKHPDRSFHGSWTAASASSVAGRSPTWTSVRRRGSIRSCRRVFR